MKTDRCPICGAVFEQAPRGRPRITCSPECRNRRVSARHRAVYRELRDAGMCGKCGRDTGNGFAFCDSCRGNHRRRSKVIDELRETATSRRASAFAFGDLPETMMLAERLRGQAEGYEAAASILEAAHGKSKRKK